MHGYYSYSILPARVATSFSLSGVPNGWSPKREFFMLFYFITYGINILLTFVVPRSLSRKPASVIKIPNKDYWLATDQRRSEYIKLMKTMMFGIALLMNFMFGVLFYGIVQSNVAPVKPFSIWTFIVPVGPLLVFIVVYSLTAFRKPEE
jgi:uncharacterized membrane protein